MSPKSSEQALAPAVTRHVLIVDDDPAILDVYEMTFTDLGYIPIVTRDAGVAIEMAIDFEPVLIILDQRMPVVTGLELARQLRGIVSPMTPIVLVSAGRDLAEQALAAGATLFIEKPFDVNNLIEEVVSRTETSIALTA